jgi:hypothetical protein
MALLSNVRGVVRTYFLRHRSGGLEDHPLDLQVYLTGLRPESPVWATVPQQTVARHVPRWDMQGFAGRSRLIPSDPKSESARRRTDGVGGGIARR